MDMKRAYYEDIELFKTGAILFRTIVLMVALFTILLISTNYYLYHFNLILVQVILASASIHWSVQAGENLAGEHTCFLVIGVCAAVPGGLMSIPGVPIGGAIRGLLENFFGCAWPVWKPITGSC
jgi:hypothetical protein